MRHRVAHLLAALLAFVVLAAGPLHTSGAALTHHTYAPQVVLPQAPMTDPVKLVDHDLGFINATSIGGRFYVAYQLRPEGQVVVAEHTITGLVPLANPSAVLTKALGVPEGVTPELVLPGSKQGSVSMLPDGPYLRIYFTGRPPGDPNGPFFGWYWVIDPTTS